MDQIQLSELIITCEACGNVKRFSVFSQEDCDQQIQDFHCENNCGRNMYSFITVGTIMPSSLFLMKEFSAQEKYAPFEEELIIH